MTLTYSPLTAAGPLVELADMKLYLRVDSDAEDTLIQSLILSAGTEAEHITHRVLAVRGGYHGAGDTAAGSLLVGQYPD